MSDDKQCDVFVIFGITGDLAKVMTFRSLYRLEQRQLLDCPIVGVAVDDWSVDQLVERARTSIVGTGEQLDEDVFARLAARLLVRLRRLRRRRDFRAGRHRDQGLGAARLLPRDPAVPLRPGREGTLGCRAHAGCPRRRREAVRARPRVGPRRSPASCTSTSTSRSCSASTTTSGRWGSRRSSICGSRTRCSSRCGTGTTWRACRSRWPRTSASRTAATSTTRSARCRDVVVNHLMQVVAATAMEAPAGGDPQTIKDAQTAVFRSVVAADPANYVRGQYDGYRAIDGVASDSATETFAALRLDIDNWRWAGVPFFIRTGKRLPVTQTEVRLVFKHPPRLGFGLRTPTRSPTSSSSGSTRRPESVSSSTPAVSHSRHAGNDPPRHGVRRRRRRGRDAVRGAAARGDGRARPCASPGRTAWRRRGASCSRSSTRRRRCTRTRPVRGARRPRPPSSPVTAVGTIRGSSS